MPIVSVCPYCRTEYSLSDEYAGRQDPCPRCGESNCLAKPIGPYEVKRLLLVTIAFAVLLTLIVLVLAYVAYVG
jgi:hypothetical protein